MIKNQLHWTQCDLMTGTFFIVHNISFSLALHGIQWLIAGSITLSTQQNWYFSPKEKSFITTIVVVQTHHKIRIRLFKLSAAGYVDQLIS